MTRIIVVSGLAYLLLNTVAFGQQQPDPAFLQRSISIVQAQRNQALDSVAFLAAKVDGLTEELTKAQARIKELETEKENAAK